MQILCDTSKRKEKKTWMRAPSRRAGLHLSAFANTSTVQLVLWTLTHRILNCSLAALHLQMPCASLTSSIAPRCARIVRIHCPGPGKCEYDAPRGSERKGLTFSAVGVCGEGAPHLRVNGPTYPSSLLTCPPNDSPHLPSSSIDSRHVPIRVTRTRVAALDRNE